MTDRPILFSTPMVRALLDGRKTQTRRLAWRQVITYPGCPKSWSLGEHRSDGHTYLPTVWQKAEPGDRLWVKETYGAPRADHPRVVSGRKPQPGDRLVYRANPADDWQWRSGHPSRADFVWRPSIYMFRWASRLTLVVTDVRVQRLQEISEEDCLAEGPPNTEYAPGFLAPDETFIRTAPGLLATPRAWYRELWDEINGKGAWDANPDVVALTFTVHQCNIDAMGEAA